MPVAKRGNCTCRDSVATMLQFAPSKHKLYISFKIKVQSEVYASDDRFLRPKYVNRLIIFSCTIFDLMISRTTWILMTLTVNFNQSLNKLYKSTRLSADNYFGWHLRSSHNAFFFSCLVSIESCRFWHLLQRKCNISGVLLYYLSAQ